MRSFFYPKGIVRFKAASLVLLALAVLVLTLGTPWTSLVAHLQALAHNFLPADTLSDGLAQLETPQSVGAAGGHERQLAARFPDGPVEERVVAAGDHRGRGLHGRT